MPCLVLYHKIEEGTTLPTCLASTSVPATRKDQVLFALFWTTSTAALSESPMMEPNNNQFHVAIIGPFDEEGLTSVVDYMITHHDLLIPGWVEIAALPNTEET